MSQVSGKRLSDNIEVAPPAAKRQTLESSKGSSHVLGSSLLPAPAVPKAEARHPDQQSSQLPSDVESVLL